MISNIQKVKMELYFQWEMKKWLNRLRSQDLDCHQSQFIFLNFTRLVFINSSGKMKETALRDIQNSKLKCSFQKLQRVYLDVPRRPALINGSELFAYASPNVYKQVSNLGLYIFAIMGVLTKKLHFLHPRCAEEAVSSRLADSL